MKRYDLQYLDYQHSHDGHAVFRFILSRMNQYRQWENFECELKLTRSNISYIMDELKRFADEERKEIAQLPL